jgi:DNA-binding winged helix-turn-helix (wHTH) protein
MPHPAAHVGRAPVAGIGVTYRFDVFTLDSDTRRLLREKEEVHLSPKAFDLLTLLVEGRSRAMSKADLHRQLWPSTYVVDTNLASLVAEIRRALGDSERRPASFEPCIGSGTGSSAACTSPRRARMP